MKRFLTFILFFALFTVHAQSTNNYLYEALKQKQELIDSRRIEIQKMYDNFYVVATAKVYELKNNFTTEHNNYVKQIGDLLIKYSSYDLSNNSVWYQIKNFYTKHTAVISNW